MPFQKGQSGNPGGRKKKDDTVKRVEELARQYTDIALDALADECKNGKGQPRVAAANALLDRGYGKPIERQETGEPGDFEKASTDELEKEARELLTEAIKGGFVKALPRKTA